MLFFYRSFLKSLTLFISISLVISFSFNFAYAISKYTSTGYKVTGIQQLLSSLGYYKDKIDGTFSIQTIERVIAFENDNKLNPDGIVGQKTISDSDSASHSTNSKFTQSEIILLAKIISAESKDEPYIGQVAVGAVILNRIYHPSFPNSISGVIFQPSAFSCVNDRQISEPVSDLSIKAANDAINGWDPTNGAVYYYNPSKTVNKLICSKDVICTIGNHKFCL